MGYMNYVKFENTYRNLQDIQESLWDDNLSESEEKYRKWLIKLCKEIADDAYFDFVEEE